MSSTRTVACFLAVMCCASASGAAKIMTPEIFEAEKLEYRKDMNSVIPFLGSLEVTADAAGRRKYKDLKVMEKFADHLVKKWQTRNRKHFAGLMLKVCGQLGSGMFRGDQQYTLARKYALLALAEPDKIPLETEVGLIGHMMTAIVVPRAPKGQEWVQQRKTDTKVRLHAWKRLKNAIDPAWDPNDMPLKNITPPAGVRVRFSGMSPESIKDPVLRAEYEMAIKENREKAKRYNRQYRLRKVAKRFHRKAERYIIRSYSHPPFDLEELKQYLEKYIADEKTRARMLAAVKKNMKEREEASIIKAYSTPPFDLDELKKHLMEKYPADEEARERILDAVRKRMKN